MSETQVTPNSRIADHKLKNRATHAPWRPIMALYAGRVWDAATPAPLEQAVFARGVSRRGGGGGGGVLEKNAGDPHGGHRPCDKRPTRLSRRDQLSVSVSSRSISPRYV